VVTLVLGGDGLNTIDQVTYAVDGRRPVVIVTRSSRVPTLLAELFYVLEDKVPRSVTASLTGQWRSQKFSIGDASICSIPFCTFPFSCPMRRPITLRNHIPKNYVFFDRGCVRPLRHLYGYATVTGLCNMHRYDQGRIKTKSGLTLQQWRRID